MIHSSLEYFDLAWTIVAGLLTPGIVSAYYSSMQERYFLLFLYNSTYILFWPPPNLQEWQKLDHSYFKNSDLISALPLGLGLSFWDINSTDIGDGQPYGLSPPPYLSATSAPVTCPSPIWSSVSSDSTESPMESFGVEISGITFVTLGYL